MCLLSWWSTWEKLVNPTHFVEWYLYATKKKVIYEVVSRKQYVLECSFSQNIRNIVKTTLDFELKEFLPRRDDQWLTLDT